MFIQQVDGQSPAKQSLSRLLALIARNVQEDRQDLRFCFILGSGASKPSGIPTADELAKRWVEDLKSELTLDEIQLWSKTINLNDSNLAEKYSSIYEKRFELDPSEGYAFLEKVMENIEPSCGYSVLAQVLAKTNHNVVITTNFDYLIEDALYTYANKKPLVCGHESLSGFVKPYSKRPIIAKIHRDLLMAPKSTGMEIANLPDTWTNALEGIFRFYTPVVIGYGGNDGSLMNLLEKTSNLNHGLFWCYRESSEPAERIKKLVKQHNGYLVPIQGFDEMMVLLNEQLEYELLDNQILEIAQRRSDSYLEQFANIQGNPKIKSAQAKKALEKLIKSDLEGWRKYILMAEGENDTQAQDEIYKEGIEAFPLSHELKVSYAEFLVDVFEKYDQAECLYQEALALAPEKTDYLVGLADFIKNVRDDDDMAEDLYKKALLLDSQEASYHVSYARFLAEKRKNYVEAEDLFKKAIELDPFESSHYLNYGDFLRFSLTNDDEAEKMYLKALELDPEERRNLITLAEFLETVRHQEDQARVLREKVTELDSYVMGRNI